MGVMWEKGFRLASWVEWGVNFCEGLHTMSFCRRLGRKVFVGCPISHMDI